MLKLITKKDFLFRVLLVIEIIITLLIIITISKRNAYNLAEMKIKKDEGLFAIMLNDGSGEYVKSNSEDFPTRYNFNSEKSNCMDNNGEIIPNILSFDISTNKVNVRTTKTVYCYLYFDKKTSLISSESGYYLLSDEGTQAYTEPIHVKVVLDSKQEDDYSTGTATSEVYDVKLTPTNSTAKVYNVRDVMLALSDQYPDISFYDADYNLIDGTSTYLYAVMVGEHVYMPSLPMMDMSFDGWYFRVNDKLPIESMTGAPTTNGMKGATIATTTVKAGDVVHFYWNYPYNKTNEVYSAKFITADGTYDNGHLTIQLKSSYDHYDKSYNWEITDFANFSGETGNYAVKVYDATTNAATPVATGTIPASGQGTIDCTLTTGHDYYIQVDSASYVLVYGADSDVWILDTTMAYSKLIN